MADEKDAIQRIAAAAPDAVVDVAQAALAMQLAAAGFDATAILGAIGAIPIGMAVIKSAFAFFGRSKEQDATRWWNETARRYERRTRGNFHKRIAERIDQRAVHETIVRSARALTEIVDPAAIPLIAELTAEYLHHEWKADRFFRGMLRALSDLNEAQINQLRLIVDYLMQHQRPEGFVAFDMQVVPTTTGVLIARVENVETGPYVEPPTIPDGIEIFSVLKANLIGADNPGGFPDTVSGPQVCVIRLEEVDHIARLFRAE